MTKKKSMNKTSLGKPVLWKKSLVKKIFVKICYLFLFYIQQLFGPKKILLVSAISSGVLSWMFIVMASSSVPCLLLSQACAGFSFGLLIGNVYLAGVVSNKFLGSFKMIEVPMLGLCSHKSYLV